jgi:hypothetical protein
MRTCQHLGRSIQYVDDVWFMFSVKDRAAGPEFRVAPTDLKDSIRVVAAESDSDLSWHFRVMRDGASKRLQTFMLIVASRVRCAVSHPSVGAISLEQRSEFTD